MSSFKDLGNAELKKGNFEKAIQYYTEGIEEDPKNKVLFSNRCAAFCRVNKYEAGLRDANKVIEIDPKWIKGYLRKGKCLHALDRLSEANDVYLEAEKIDPNDRVLKKSLEELTKDMKQNSFSGLGQIFSDPNFFSKIENNPKLSKYLQDPDFKKIMEQIQKDPNSLNQYIKDKRVIDTMTQLLMSQIPGMQKFEQQQQQNNENNNNDDEKEDIKMEEKKQEKKKEKVEEEKEEEEDEETEKNKKKALEKKLEGNKLYYKKDFEKALEKYEEAIKLDPKNMIYLLNKASIFIEQKKIDEAIKICDEAIDIGRDNLEDFKIIAKGLVKKGNAYLKIGKYEEGIKCLKESLTEHRNKDVVKKLYKIEREYEEKKKLAYINPEIAEKEKQKGNEAFKKMDFPTAMKHYKEAIKRNPNSAPLLVNRATTYMRLGEFMYAKKDCESALKIDSNYIKAYERKGRCHFYMKEYHKAIETYEKGLKIDPNHPGLVGGLQKVTNAIYMGGSEKEQKERANRARADPEIQKILSDPMMQSILQEMSSDPMSAQRHMRNPEIRNKINKLIASGIIQTK